MSDAPEDNLDPYRSYPDELRPELYDLEEKISDLMTQLENGEIEPDPWKEAFINLVGLGMAGAIIAGAMMGGRIIPRSDVTGIIKPNVANQLKYLDGFYGAIIDSPEFNRIWRSRARLYVTSIVAPFWQGYSYGLALPAVPGDGTSQCGQNDRCSWEIEWIDEANGDADAFWTLHPAEHCQTCKERARVWNPLQFRGGQMIDIPMVKELEFEAVKHLLGRHNQKKHGNRFGHVVEGYSPEIKQLYEDIPASIRAKVPPPEVRISKTDGNPTFVMGRIEMPRSTPERMGQPGERAILGADFSHEFAHYMDYRTGASNSPAFKKVFEASVKRAESMDPETFMKSLKGGYSTHEQADILLGAFSGGKKGGHGEGYYSEASGRERKEAFAAGFTVTNFYSPSLLKQFPELANYFSKMFGDRNG